MPSPGLAPQLAAATAPASAVVPASPAAVGSGQLRPPVVPVAGGDAPIDFEKHYVIINGHKAHPTRLLAKFAPRAEQDGVAKSLAQNQYAAFSFRLNRSGLLQLDSTAGQPAEVGSQAEARKQGELVQERIKALKASGQFDYVEPDYIVSVNTQPTDAAFLDGTLWALRNAGQSGGLLGADIDAVRAWDITTGSTNVIVAVIDTGIRYTHQDLAAQMWRNPQEIPGNGIDDDGNGYVDDVFGINAISGSGNPMDDNNHGTHCAGTIGAAANGGGGHVGVAWRVQLMACKFLDSSGSGATSHAIRCIDYAVAKRARILSNSWGGGGFSQGLFDSIQAARDQGVIFIAAAGNDASNNDSSPHYPSNYELDNVVSVAAFDRLDKLASFSNFGARSVHLGAPGVQIYSTTAGSDTAYSTFNGTSMATPHVSGVAALVAAQFPAIGLAELKQRLINTVVPTTDLQGRVASGGRVNAFNALNAAPDGTLEVAVGAAPSPLRAAQSAVFIVTVTDLTPVTNATVTAAITALGTNLSFLNNGVAPDVSANDQFYTASLTVPAGLTNLTLLVTVTAPGKTTFTTTNNFAVQSPPANDLFASRATLAGTNATATGHNVGAGRETGEPTHAGLGGGRSVWWTWTAPGSGAVTVRTFGSSFDTVLAVYSGSAVNALTQIGANDDSGGSLQSQVIFNATSGTTYQIAVDGYSSSVGNISLSLTAALGGGSPPPNDNFASRTALSGATNSVSGATDNATKESGEPNHAGNPGGRSAWWSWTAPSDGSYTLDTFGSAFDTLLAVYTGSAVNALTAVASNDNSGGTLQSRVTFTAVGGTTYQIAVDGFGGSFGRVQLSFSQPVVVAPPPNDGFANRLTLTGTNTSSVATNTAATKETGEPNHAGNSGGRSVWWTWTAPSNGSVTLTTAGSTFNTLLAVYTGSTVGSLTAIASNNNDPGGGLTSRVAFSVVSGQTYQIAVDGNNDGLGAASGTALVNLAFNNSVLPLNDNFSSRVALTGATNDVTGSNLGATRETGEPVHAGAGGGRSVWWSWTAPATASVTIRTLGSSFDTVLAIYTGISVTALTQIAANDDSGGTLQSSVTFTATAGTVYQIAVDGLSSASGNIALSIQQTPPPPAISLAAALDTTNLVWSTGGNAVWSGTDSVTHDGVDAAQSGLIGHSQSTYVETTVIGPGTLAFWWKVSSESGYDYLRLNLDGSSQFSISGEVNWQQRTLTVPAGTHILRWVYGKDGSVVSGQDRGWVDTVLYTNISVTPPTIGGQPADLTLNVGANASFSVAATGSSLQYQWRKGGANLANGGNIFGATAATLNVSGVQTGDAGNYSVVVSNPGGSVTSSNAVLTVTNLMVTPLTNGVGVVSLVGASNSVRYFVLAVPPSQTNLTISISDGTGDCDLYVRFGALPTLTQYDHRPYLPGNVESVSITNPAAGNWYFMLNGYDSYSGVRLLAQYSGGTTGFAFFDDFEPGIDLSQWSSFGGSVGSTVLATNYGGRVSGVNSLWFGDSGTRHATTRPLDTSVGGVISFYIRLASGSSFPWEQVDLPSEGIVLESSVNGGSAWTELGRYATTNYYNWTSVTSSIPTVARSAATLFRWRQLSHSGSSFDHWALDDVQISSDGTLPPPPPPGMSVGVFDHPSFVDTGGGTTAESDNVQASLQFLGYTVATFTNIASGLAGRQVVLIPELENGDLAAALTAADRTALQGFVSGGGTLIVHGTVTLTRAAALINTILASSVTEQRETDGVVYQRSGAAAGTPFADDAATLAAMNGSSALVTASLPSGALPIYTNGTRSMVAVLPQGTGRLVFLGWDWFDAAPVGVQNGGWLTVLQSAVSLAGANTNPPVILTPPSSQTNTVGALVNFSVVVSGASPLAYQWRKEGFPIAGATNSSFAIATVQTNDAGAYSVTISNPYGTNTSANASLTVVPAGLLEFQIQTLTTNSAQILEVNSLTGDDRGGLVLSAARVFLTGDSATAGFSAADLSGGSGLGRVFDSLCADLRAETVYVLGNGSTVLNYGGGTVTTLLQLDPLTGQTNGTVITLSQSIPMTAGAIFSGYGRIVLHNGSRVYDIAMPSGVVTDRGVMAAPPWSVSESWAIWGVAEFFAGNLYLTYARGGVYPVTTIERARVPDGVSSTVATFASLSDLASFSVSPSRGRWYFHYEGSGQFGGFDETLGFAAASFSFAPPTNPPTITTHPASQTVAVGGTASFAVSAAGPAPLTYQWRRNAAAIPGATSTTYTLAGVQSNDAGAFDVVVSNPYGTVTSSNAALTVSLTPQPRVAIYGAPATDSWNTDVRNKVLASGLFSQVDVFRVDTATPTLAELQQYAAVLVYSDASFANAQNLGNVLADYVDAGGGVVIGTFAHSTTFGFAGRLATGGYLPFTLSGGSSAPGGLTLVINQSGHPILAGVSSFNGGSSSYHNDISATAGTTLVASWSNGRPLVGARQVGLSRLVGLNFYPPSSAARSDFWSAGTDGGRIMANSLLWAASQSSGVPVITLQPQPVSVTVGSSATFQVVASGGPPLNYQWRKTGQGAVPGATNSTFTIASAQSGDAGTYDVVVGNPMGSVTSSTALLTVTTVLTLGDAVDAPHLTWSTGGSAPWVAQTNITHDAVDAAASGDIGHSQDSWMETTVTGPGALTFWWKVSSEGSFDYLTMSLDGASQFAISGEVNWEQRSLTVGAGTHTLRWRYSKDGSVVRGTDKGWLDQVVFTPVANQVDHFVWNAVGTTQFVGVPFPVTITAQNVLNSNVTTFSGTVALTGLVGGGQTSGDLLGSPAHASSGSGNWTLGYAFTPATNLTVTHARHYFGSKVSIWTDAGTLLAAQNVTSTPGQWAETPLTTPLQLTAGVGYRIGAYTASGSYFWRSDPGTSFPAGTLVAGGLEIAGDAFPTSSDGERWLVSLRYTVGTSVPVPVIPAVSGNFVNGVWSGSVAVPQLATNLVLLASDGSNHVGTSTGFAVVATLPTNNQPPVVTLTSPANGASFLAPATFALNASASDPDAGDAVAKVEFYRGGLKLGEHITTPYSFAVSNLAAGAYVFSAVATDTFGARSLTNSLSVTVTNLASSRLVRLATNSASPGDTVVLPIDLVSQGDENAFGFSVSFATNQLTFLGATSGTNASGLQLNVNANQLASGRVGLAGALPFGTSFSAGTRQVVQLSFRVSAALAAGVSAPVTFADLPIPRELSDILANVLPTQYADGGVGVVAFAGFEGDVSPRPGGSGTVSITDWVQVGRFVSGLDTPATGGEFQRADCAPRSTFGNGVLSITDWVQAGRYASGLDPLTAAAGPTSAGTTALSTTAKKAPEPVTGLAARTVRMVSGALMPGQTNTVAVQLVAAGDENALGFSFEFNPSVWTFVQAVAGSGAGAAQFNVNTNQAVASGRVGIVAALPAGSTFPAGTAEIARITLVAAAEAGSTTISFVDQPVAREISDALAQPLTDVTYEDGTFTGGSPLVITSQPQSVLTNWGASVTFRVTASGSGLSYQWRRNGLNLPSQTATNLVLSNVNRGHSGVYSVEVSNGASSLVSSNAVLRVLVPQRAELPARLPDGRFRFMFGDRDGGLLSSTNLAGLEIQASTNFVNWVTITNGITVTNGQFLVEDDGVPGAARRFYRVIER